MNILSDFFRVMLIVAITTQIVTEDKNKLLRIIVIALLLFMD